jgi:hypothetical protein
MSRDAVIRIGLLVLGLPSVVIGLWAGFWPRSFYEDFPGLGRVWVAVDGPYNEHFIRDVGWLNLALAFVTLIAAWRLGRTLVGAVLGAWLVYGVPHLTYHLNHLDTFDTGDQVALTASLALTPIIAIVLLALQRQSDRAASATIPPSESSTRSSSSST